MCRTIYLYHIIIIIIIIIIITHYITLSCLGVTLYKLADSYGRFGVG